MKAKWLLIALFAPELIVYNAWRQRREAHELVRILRAHHGQLDCSPFHRRVIRWFSKTKVTEIEPNTSSLVRVFLFQTRSMHCYPVRK